ncbi:hypothetical protein Plano_0534 [Planococcus sp. PAMC 21323]|uniref:hypothetical protein n=1 Tax=Planococcus sp. PAMC 21323 TaxID=1526927 RepID=UPI0005719590|nr:hypothetical protein [Planococcus sp. PAMC 21323]AIY04499.1 hypothetical protein Plano_0534 [Planococcus sp. PAMC 21323]
MKTSSLSILLTCLLLFSGCSPTDPTVTENEAAALVEQHHINSIGTVDILSVGYESGQYIVEWENKENCEWGIDYVDGQSGSIKMGEATIC